MSPAPRAGLSRRRQGPGAHAPGYCNVARCAGWVVTASSRSGAHAPGYCNVARCAGCAGTGVVKDLGLTPQAMLCRPLRLGNVAWSRSWGSRPRLLQCRPLRGLRWHWRGQGPGAHAPGYCNVARSAGCAGTGVVKVLGLTPQAIAMSPAARAGLALAWSRSWGSRPRLLQCRPLRGLGWHGRGQGPGAYAPGYCNVAGCAGSAGIGVVEVQGLTPQGLLQCRPDLRGLRLSRRRRVLRAHAPGCGNVARCAGWVGAYAATVWRDGEGPNSISPSVCLPLSTT